MATAVLLVAAVFSALDTGAAPNAHPALFSSVNQHHAAGHFVMQHVQVQAADATGSNSNITRPSNISSVPRGNSTRHVAPLPTATPVPVSPYPLPIHVIANDIDIDIIESGFCFESCKYSTAKSFASWTWYSTVAERLSYNVTITSMNPLIATGALALTTRGGAAATFGVIPLQNDPEEFPYFHAISLQPVCRSTGIVVLHVEVSDARSGFQPVHFFAKHVCSVPVTADCETVQCGPHGVCNQGKCECQTNYFGADCGHSIFDSCPDKCTGRGVNCVANDGAFSCVCEQGFTGPSCAVSVGCASLDYCNGHGECLFTKACACDHGWTGITCNRTTDTDSTCQSLNYCKGHGKCVARGRTFGCECDRGFEGADCGLVAAMCPSSCSGHGICKDSTCECNFGFRGSDCSEAFSPCGGCMHGTCSESVDDTSAKCVCRAGFTGLHCSTYDLYSDPCQSTGFCSAHGKCNGTACQCAPGFSGPNCERVVANGCVNGCSGHGICDMKSDVCVCNSAWSGPDCGTSRCPSTNGTVCSGHGACSPQGDVMECVCISGFFGSSCHNAYCSHNVTCHGHGTCKKSSGVWDRLCECNEGWAGPTCDKPTAKFTVKAASLAAKNIARKNDNAIEISESMDDFLDTAP